MTAQIEKREIGNLILENIPEIPAKLSDKLNHYQNTREAVVVDWLRPGNGLLISTCFGEAAQLHLVEEAGGNRRQLTFFNEPVFSASVCPAAETNGFLFSKDVGGNENYQLYFFDLDSGCYEMLTDGSSKHGNGIWNKEGSALLYSSTKRNQKDHDLYLLTVSGKRREKRVFEGEGYWYPVDWSPDGRHVAVINYLSINESRLYILDLTNGKLKPVLAQENVACRDGYWEKSGKGLFFSSDLYSECRQMMYCQLESGRISPLMPGVPWDVEGMSLSPDGKKLACVFNDNGISRLYIMDSVNRQYQSYEQLPDGIVGALRWHPDSHRLAVTVNTPQAPSDVYVLDIFGGELVRWTYSEVGGLSPRQFVKPSLAYYPTFDQLDGEARKIPAFYYRPVNADGPHPVLIYIHGGPESQYRPGFSPTFQYYLNELGVAIVAPNVRGSTGYGKSYLKLDNGYKREDSVRDIGKLLDWIAGQPELDESRVAVMGGSYGGYMVLASMAHFNGRLRCGIDMVGISNFVTFLENTKSYRRNLRRVEYGDERDPRMRRHLERISPTTNAHKITKPMLIVQGLNDPRVPASEAEQMLRAIRKNGGEAWYLLAKDEGHGFRKKSNRDFYNKAVILFLQRYLLGK